MWTGTIGRVYENTSESPPHHKAVPYLLVRIKSAHGLPRFDGMYNRPLQLDVVLRSGGIGAANPVPIGFRCAGKHLGHTPLWNGTYELA